MRTVAYRLAAGELSNDEPAMPPSPARGAVVTRRCQRCARSRLLRGSDSIDSSLTEQ